MKRPRNSSRTAKSTQHIILMTISARYWPPILLAAGAAYFATRSITRPIRELVDDAGKLAAGDTSVAFATAARGDAIGSVAVAVATFRDTVIEQKRLAEEFQRRSTSGTSAIGTWTARSKASAPRPGDCWQLSAKMPP